MRWQARIEWFHQIKLQESFIHNNLAELVYHFDFFGILYFGIIIS